MSGSIRVEPCLLPATAGRAAQPRPDIAMVILSNPGRLNALDRAMWQGLRDTLRALSQDNSLRCIVLRGEGEAAFAAGADDAGDVIAVTGTLGESAAGLAVLRDPALRDLPGAIESVERHRRPHPRLVEGQALAPIVHAMMDVSDGIATDLRRLARRSGVQLHVDLDALRDAPASASCVVGLGAMTVKALGADLPDLRELTAYAGPGFGMPATPFALLIWLRGEDRGEHHRPDSQRPCRLPSDPPRRWIAGV